MEANINEKLTHFMRVSGLVGGSSCYGFLSSRFQLLFYYLIPYFIMLALGYTTEHRHGYLPTHPHRDGHFTISYSGAPAVEYSFEMIFKSYISSTVKLLAMILWRLLTYYLGMAGWWQWSFVQTR